MTTPSIDYDDLTEAATARGVGARGAAIAASMTRPAPLRTLAEAGEFGDLLERLCTSIAR